MDGIKYRYSFLYKDIAECPELGLFRRFIKEWSWILYDHCAEINRLENECNALIASKTPNGVDVYTVTDVHRAHMVEGDPELNSKIEELKKKIRKFSKDSCLAHAVARLPNQSQVYAKRFRRYDNLFEEDIFGPTGECGTFYCQNPLHPDMWSLKALDRQDVLSDFVINHIEGIMARITRLVFWRKEPDNVEDQPAPESVNGIALDTIRGLMNLFTGLYAPLIFTTSMVIISCLSTPKIQIAVVGVLGGVLSVSVQLIVENVKRAELFTIAAGYYAVLGVFIGATSGGSRCANVGGGME